MCTLMLYTFCWLNLEPMRKKEIERRNEWKIDFWEISSFLCICEHAANPSIHFNLVFSPIIWLELRGRKLFAIENQEYARRLYIVQFETTPSCLDQSGSEKVRERKNTIRIDYLMR